jgi:hypothetical protein
VTDLERFETVLRELGEVWLRLGDLAEHVMVIGGQVIALESRTRGGDGVIEVETSVGPKVVRGYSFDLDLLYDGEAGWMGERLPEVLRSCGFERSTSFRWTKLIGTQRVDIDLLVAPSPEPMDLPTPMTTAPGGDIAVLRPRRVQLTSALQVSIPSPLGFLALKIEAKKLRPKATKDSFDLFAYVNLMTPQVISEALAAGGADGERLRQEIRNLFGAENAPGVLDVLAYAGTLEPTDQQLVARAVVDLMLKATVG